MRVLLDTSAYSAFKRGHPEILERIRIAKRVCLNTVVLAELLQGFLAGRHEARNRRELAEFLEAPRVEFLALGRETAERFVAIHRTLRAAGTPLPVHDLWIAASAMEHGLRVLTLDAHYLKIPQILADHIGP
ncbi:MAG: type II toxin-antitoxin system VapC family toxin [Armatimonadetes bacterium]|nr:type II toxin-antitoxin system VapC family toxin [Armatimonadota bacterium]